MISEKFSVHNLISDFKRRMSVVKNNNLPTIVEEEMDTSYILEDDSSILIIDESSLLFSEESSMWLDLSFIGKLDGFDLENINPTIDGGLDTEGLRNFIEEEDNLLADALWDSVSDSLLVSLMESDGVAPTVEEASDVPGYNDEKLEVSTPNVKVDGKVVQFSTPNVKVLRSRR